MNILIIGKAKTGTTIISKTIENSLNDVAFHMEPKNLNYFLNTNFSRKKNNVIKIIFEHWNKTPKLRLALINNELDIKFDKIVFIIRDPRDEMISRMMYFIKPHFDNYGFDKKIYSEWLDVVKQKENRPQEISFIDMQKKMSTIFDINLGPGFNLMRTYFNFSIQLKKQKKGAVCFIKYEDFIDQKVEDLERYLSFHLNFNINSKESVIQRTKRSASYNNWKTFFLPSDIQFIMKNIGAECIQFGYLDWSLDNQLKPLSSNMFSDYIKRIANQ